MSDLLPALESIVYSLVPASRNDASLRNELLVISQDILQSRIGQRHEADIGHLSDLIKRQLLQTTGSESTSLRFTNLLSRLLDQPVLSRKHACVQFLQSVASSTRQHPTTTPPFLPSLAPPPPSRKSASPATPSPRSPLPNTGKSKAQRLREYRLQSVAGSPLPEHLLLRDTLYLLQGISGKYVQLSSQRDLDEQHTLEFVENGRYYISAPTKALIHRLSEVGYLYTRVDAFVQEREGASGVGMIEQSLCHHLQSKLTEYYRLIAVLESQMPNAPLDGESNPDLESGLTLWRLDVWINEWRLRMRMMSVCVEGAKESHGGALVNLIHSYTDNGDPFIRTFTDQLLEEVSKPFFSTLHKWLFSGELYDPFGEFFVAVDPSLAQLQYMHPSSLAGGIDQLAGGKDDLKLEDEDRSREREGGLRLWEEKYRFRREMLPMFVGEAFGKKIFSTGKSLNFIRYSCHDSDWVATREKMSNTGGSLKYSDISGLERSIDAAYSLASQRLFDVYIEKFKLLDHLNALKDYLLLGHGDFADQLMLALGPSLSKPANTLFRHNLTATLEAAIRSSNAQNDPSDVLRRLDARMLEYSRGEIGWDVFTLEYKVDPPVDTVIDPDSMVQYLRLFNHLWKMKRIEGTLSQCWMRLAGGARTILRIPELDPAWHQIRGRMAEMVHFIRQLQAYCRSEVIDSSWKTLMEFLNKREGDLDAMIEAHQGYLGRMVRQILLLTSKVGKEENVLVHVTDLFSIVIQYREAVDNFYNYCLTESARRDRLHDEERGIYSGPPQGGSDEEPLEEALPRLMRPINEYGNQFTERMHTLIQHLTIHTDHDCRRLGIRLNFSDFYRSKKDAKS
ncbi:Microtubule-nucleating Tub4p (gamma-tubulin) complex component [Marasmius tenuissimus]|uniref:Microtubule-nucleating Tub4p (Gamma-tubulin) complex component n=1 Tax=Marasmius tenuissimus TaxID=585030 RepID=A0ABR3A9Z3_9AGAR